ncbi:hypothetical protein AVEN_26041-1 [Araneus ventricosus]|uniref:Uncharacterized protein n=1 Tax=Araneus ventricosus TaxID=182803 RepID=A0A4Y2IP15_ARAVE|nr:hypothetical protein AVEN_258141-1 [Araneus ventricosus]GBM78939.1 hypothetical protein AVEN_26041-1 [Araneus ventricosus]
MLHIIRDGATTGRWLGSHVTLAKGWTNSEVHKHIFIWVKLFSKCLLCLLTFIFSWVQCRSTFTLYQVQKTLKNNLKKNEQAQMETAPDAF